MRRKVIAALCGLTLFGLSWTSAAAHPAQHPPYPAHKLVQCFGPHGPAATPNRDAIAGHWYGTRLVCLTHVLDATHCLKAEPVPGDWVC